MKVHLTLILFLMTFIVKSFASTIISYCNGEVDIQNKPVRLRAEIYYNNFRFDTSIINTNKRSSTYKKSLLLSDAFKLDL